MSEVEKIGILIVGHGSPRDSANQGFIQLVGRIAARLGGMAARSLGGHAGANQDSMAAAKDAAAMPPIIVLPTFFSIARPSIQDRLAELHSAGVRRVLLMPYFLYTGQHVSKDIPALLAACQADFPGLHVELLPTLENEPALEDIVVERLARQLASAAALPTTGPEIEARSHQIIDQWGAEQLPADPAERAIVRRVIHATADFSFARSMRIHPKAVEVGLAALKQGRPVFCDVRMLAAGVTHAGGEVLCAIGDPDVIEAAKANGCTRAAAAMEKLAPRFAGAIMAVGNAPTAIWRLLEIAKAGGPRPALVVGLPVGLVGARESKLALAASDLVYITNDTARGGSPAAAAVVNALAKLAKEAV